MSKYKVATTLISNNFTGTKKSKKYGSMIGDDRVLNVAREIFKALVTVNEIAKSTVANFG